MEGKERGGLHVYRVAQLLREEHKALNRKLPVKVPHTWHKSEQHTQTHMREKRIIHACYEEHLLRIGNN